MHLHLRALPLCGLLALAACGRDGTTGLEPEPLQPGIVAVAGHGLTDTVDARPVQALIVEVRSGSRAAPTPNVVVRFEAVPVPVPGCTVQPCGTTSSMRVGGLADAAVGPSAAATTNAEGRASVRVVFGTAAGAGKVVVTVPELGLQDTVRYTVNAGAAARVRVLPRDTVLFHGSGMDVRATVQDRYGNARSEAPALASTGLRLEGTRLTADRYGEFRVRATHAALPADSLTLGVVPRGTIAAAPFPESPAIDVFETDGSGRTPLRLPGTMDGFDWAADGSRLLVSYRPTQASPVKVHSVGLNGAATVAFPADPARHEAHVRASPGGWVYFAGFNPAFALSRVRTDGTGHERLDVTNSVYSPSPDNSRVAWISSNHLQVYDVATRTSTPIVTNAAAWTVRWSPDGEWIAYYNQSSMNLVRPDGTGRRTLFLRDVNDFRLGFDWSPDGKWLVYERGLNLEVIEVATGTRVRLRSPSGLLYGRPEWK